jgi:hypothetical protein
MQLFFALQEIKCVLKYNVYKAPLFPCAARKQINEAI